MPAPDGADFRIRKTGDHFWVWQFEAGRWTRVGDAHGSRAAARAWIADVVAGRI